MARLQSVACLQVRHSGTRYNAVMGGDGGAGGDEDAVADGGENADAEC